MNLRLIVLSHGDCDPLLNTLMSYSGMVRPHPSSAYLHLDGPTKIGRVRAAAAAEFLSEWNWTVEESDPAVGFCGSCSSAWAEASEGQHEFAFWLEHDFRFTHAVDLEQMAAILDANPMLTQMALMRQPVNEQEREAGGVVASRPGQFQMRGGWMEQQSYWTTNPSLFRREFAVKHAWPQGKQCEGHFGIHLRSLGYTFGMMGAGEPWTEHVGVRSGFGY